MQNRITSIALLLGLLAAVLYSVLSLQQTQNDMVERTSQFSVKTPESPVNLRPTAAKDLAIESLTSTVTASDFSGGRSKKTKLPINVALKGIAMDGNQSRCLLESNGEISEYTIGDLIYGYPIQIVDIASQSIVLGFDSQRFELSLNGPNLLAVIEQKSDLELRNMTSEQIGNRPKIIEHFVDLTPTPYIADGMIASPGINPALFEQAGLKEDDVITTINGKRITIADEFSELQRTIRHADTLVIKVRRKGRTIVLYLDIPSEALTLKRE